MSTPLSEGWQTQYLASAHLPVPQIVLHYGEEYCYPSFHLWAGPLRINWGVLPSTVDYVV
jgi:hypothetical protein